MKLTLKCEVCGIELVKYKWFIKGQRVCLKCYKKIDWKHRGDNYKVVKAPKNTTAKLPGWLNPDKKCNTNKIKSVTLLKR